MKEKVLEYLKNEPRSRERSLHQRAMVNLLLKKYPELKTIEKEMLINFAKDFETCTRAWRHITENNESLRGNDYNDKKALVQAKQIELGYRPNYHNDIKKLAQL